MMKSTAKALYSIMLGASRGAGKVIVLLITCEEKGRWGDKRGDGARRRGTGSFIHPSM